MMADHPQPAAIADLQRIMEAIATAPPDKSLQDLWIQPGPTRDAMREVVHALTGPTATHTLETIVIDCSALPDLGNTEDPAYSPWLLTTIPTLREIFVYCDHSIISPSQAAILQESLRRRRLSGCPPLGAIRFGNYFDDIEKMNFNENFYDRISEFDSNMESMHRVVLAESPTTEFY